MRRKGARVVVENETEAWSRKREGKKENKRAKRMRDRRLHLESIHGGGYTIFPINYGRFCRIIRREGMCGFVQCCLKIVRHSAYKCSFVSLSFLYLSFSSFCSREIILFARLLCLLSLSDSSLTPLTLSLAHGEHWLNK